MYLEQAVEALPFVHNEQNPNGIIVSIDLGVHRRCYIGSNCPMAIKFRDKVLKEAGIGLADLVEAFNRLQASKEAPPEPLGITMPKFDGKVTLNLAGQRMELDLSAEIERQMSDELRRKASRLRDLELQIESLGRNLYNDYLRAIESARKEKKLAQLSINAKDIIKCRCHITSDGERYLFLFPIEYKPQWIWTRGERYAINPKDVKTMVREIFLVIPITPDRRIVQPYLLDCDGDKFYHYHGRAGECWGQLRIPYTWNGTLTQLADISYQARAALATINRDSLMSDYPRGLPQISDLMEDSILLGEEGQRREEPEEVEEDEGIEAPPARHWGRGR